MSSLIVGGDIMTLAYSLLNATNVIETNPSEYDCSIGTIIDMKEEKGSLSEPWIEDGPIVFGAEYDYLWLMVEGWGQWEFKIRLCTMIGGVERWADYGFTKKLNIDGTVPFKPFYMGKPNKLQIVAQGKGLIKIVARMTNRADKVYNPNSPQFIDCAFDPSTA